jgi:excinuclease UvrABC helicase subunit UvrB
MAKRILKIELTAEPQEIAEVILDKQREMKEAARKLDFETAALLRDEIGVLKKELESKTAAAPKKKRNKALPYNPDPTDNI